MLLGGLAAAAVYLRLDDSQPVLVAKRAVAAGQIIGEQDLGVVSVSVPGLARVPASQRAHVVGRPAAVDLPKGALFTPAAIGESTLLRPGEAVLGLALKGGHLPPQLRAGDRVAVVDVEPPGGPANQSSNATARPPIALTDAAVVVSVNGQRDAASATIVSVRIPRSAAEGIAAAASAGRVTLVLLPTKP